MSGEWPNLTYPSGAPMPPYGPSTEDEMITDALEWASAMLVARDQMNAAVHCGGTRLSPVTVKVNTALGLWRERHAVNEAPRADLSTAWAELTGYVMQARDDGDQLDPAELLGYMAELKQRALTPVTAWLKQAAAAAAEAPEAQR